MRLTLEQVERAGRGSGHIVVRLLVLNDTFEAVTLDRGKLIGPNPVAAHPTGVPLPISVEPETEDAVVLNPWCLYGRQRTFEAIGEATFHAYLLRHRSDELRPDGPVDPDALDVTAPPLRIS